MTNTNTQEELQGRIAELEAEISILKQQKKYGLVWEDKPEDVVLGCETHVPVLTEVKTKKIVDKTSHSENVLIEGDNYHALSVLNYTHHKKVDLIYIDPPYNTGARDWKYNNDYVDSEDTFRHSKWLSMMNNRLQLARKLLKDDGVLILTIDKHENGTSIMLLSELFPAHDVISVVIEHNPKGLPSRNFSESHEYAHYVIPKGMSVIGRSPEDKVDTRNLRRAGRASLRSERPTMFYPIYVKDGKITGVGEIAAPDFHPKSRAVHLDDGVTEVWPIDNQGRERRWNFSIDSIHDQLKRIEVKQDEKDCQLYVTAVPARYKTVWTGGELDAGKYGTTLVKNIINNEFPYPKSIFATLKCLETVVYQRKNATILDFFAGSGTTGHAVLELNKQDGGNRQFILCTNNENKIAEEITYPRVKKVIKGYGDVAGLGGSLRYYKTKLVDVEKLQKVPDEKRLSLTYQAGEMIALRENTFDETEKNEWWQIFSSEAKTVAIYFQEDKQKLRELVAKLSDKEQVVLYVFSWSKNEYTNEFAEYTNIWVEDIPEPIIEVYKEINRLK